MIIGDHIHLLPGVYVCRLVDDGDGGAKRVFVRFARGVPDPLLGPKGVRLLLVFRGFIGCVRRAIAAISLADPSPL